MITIAEALKIIERETAVLDSEAVELADCVGRVLAENVEADMSLPPFDRSQMDGFAVRTDDVKKVPARLKIIGEAVAGKGFDGKLKAGEAVRIMTGARVPKGADAVQKVELTKAAGDFVEILEAPAAGRNVNRFASEIRKGEKIFARGEIVTEQMIAALASFGYARIEVFQKPRVSILATGSEIVEIGQTPQKDQIRNSNSAMLAALAAPFAETEILPLIHDDAENLKQAIAAAVGLDEKLQITNYKLQNENQKPKTKNREPKTEEQSQKSKIQNPKSEILIVTGGVSVGDYDYTKPALRALGAEIFFEKVSLKPGKPTVFAKLNETLVFGLPGNPVSVAVTFYLFVRAAIMQMQGAKLFELKKGFAVCADRIRGAKERDSVLPVSLATDEKGRLVIASLRFSGSSNFVAFARADALARVPQGVSLEKGDVAEILFL